jgi:uncharacterized protein
MTKLILLGLIVWLAIYILNRVLNQTNTRSSNTTASKNSEGEDMVQCATCKVHLPRSDAFLVNNNFYCSKAHIQNS